MFAHEIILAKSGPLARIWLAAHWDKKLKKKDIFETKLVESVENIINPKMKLALRTSGHLLLGVVKIYSRKTGFLYTDCNEAIVKLRSAFRPGQVQDVSNTTKENKTKAKAQQLFFTADLDLPDIDTPLPDLNDLDLDKNRARLEEITLREENDFLNGDDLGLDGDQPYNSDLAIDLDNEEMMRNLNEVFGDNQMDFGGEDTNLLIDDGIKTDLDNNDQEMSMDLKSVNNETEHENPEQMLEDLQNPMSVAPSSEYSHPPATPAYSEAPPTPYSMMEDSTIDDEPFSPPPRPPRVDTADSIMDSQPPTPITASFGNIQRPMTPLSSVPPSPQPRPDNPPTPLAHYQEEMPPSPVQISQPQSPVNHSRQMPQIRRAEKVQSGPAMNPRMTLRERKENINQQNNQSHGYQIQDTIEQNRRRKIRRQLIIDQQIGIDAETMRSQLRDHADICGSLVMAPPVEKLLRNKEETNPEKLFTQPISKIHSGLHQTCFTSNCRTDLPACGILRQEEANLESFSEEMGRRQTSQYLSNHNTIHNQHDQGHDSDDDDMYSAYGGPPSVASSYHPQEAQEMSHVDNHEISNQDNQWAKAMGQDMSYQQPMSNQQISMPPSPMPASPMPASPAPQQQVHQNHQPQMTPTHPGMTPTHPGMTPTRPGMTPNHPGMTPNHPGMTPNHPQMSPGHPQMSSTLPGMTPTHPEMTPTHRQMTPTHPSMTPTPLSTSPYQADAPMTPLYDQPLASPAMSSAPPTPLPAPDTPEEYMPEAPATPQPELPVPESPMAPLIEPEVIEDLNESNYEPEPKRMRTESAEQEKAAVTAGHGIAACIKYTQRLLDGNEFVSLYEMSEGSNRKIASQQFYSLLVMLKHEHINCTQEAPYKDIVISKGINFGGVIMDHC